MRKTLIKYIMLPGTIVFLAGGLLAGCGDTAKEKEGDAGGGTATGTTTHDGSGATGTGAQDNGAENGTATMDTRSTDVDAAAATPMTPGEERTHAAEDMRGLRAILVAELEQVRARLKETGAKTEAKKADQERAAELAQGLERIDRAIKAIDESTDVTWSTIRESSLKEAGEVRAWMAQYGMNVGA